MSALSRELVILILEFLTEEKYKETAHKLERESGIFFNMEYFEEEVQNGNWDEVEKYLSGFTGVDENKKSRKMFFEIRKQKYLEALDKHDGQKAVDILVNDLKVFASLDEDLFEEITQLLTLKNFREHERLSKYGDAKSARALMLVELKKLIGANPLFRNKLQFPKFKNSRLRHLINQSLNWQHRLCKNPSPNPVIKTLFVDHSCDQPNTVHTPISDISPLFGSLPIARGFLPRRIPMPFHPSPTQVPAPRAGWMSNPPAFPAVPGGAIGLSSSTTPVPFLNQQRMRPPSNPNFGYSSVDFDLVSKRARSFGTTGKPITNPMAAAAAATGTNSEAMEKSSPPVAITGKLITNPLAAAAVAAGTDSEVMDITEMPITNPLAVAAVGTGTNSGVMDKASPFVAITDMDGDFGNIKPRITLQMSDKSNVQKLTENFISTKCRSLRLTSKIRTSKISRLTYADSGSTILALASDGIHLLWKQPRTPPGGKVDGQLWEDSSGIIMRNDTLDESTCCFAVTRNSSYALSASGGKISLFNLLTCRVMKIFMDPPPAATFIAFHPQDNNVIAIGMEDSTILIYNIQLDQVSTKIKGHSKRITGLAFSDSLRVLVSSGADSQIVVWGMGEWEKQMSKELLQVPSAASDTQVEFHRDGIRVLAVNEALMALYDARDLECTQRWAPREEGRGPISHATFSCDCRLVYAGLTTDAAVWVFDASDLRPRRRICPVSDVPGGVGSRVHVTVVAANPSKPNQFAIGLTDGCVYVVEPVEPQGSWGASPS